MRSSKTFRRSRMPRPLTAESSEELEEPSSSQLAHEDEKAPQKCMIQLDDLEIERENKKRDKEDGDYVESSQRSTRTEGTSDSMEEDEDSSGRNEGAATPTAGSQNSDDEDVEDENINDISSHDIKIIKRFLEYNGYSKDQKKLAITVGWSIGGENLRYIENWIKRHGHELDRWPIDF